MNADTTTLINGLLDNVIAKTKEDKLHWISTKQNKNFYVLVYQEPKFEIKAIYNQDDVVIIKAYVNDRELTFKKEGDDTSELFKKFLELLNLVKSQINKFDIPTSIAIDVAVLNDNIKKQFD